MVELSLALAQNSRLFGEAQLGAITALFAMSNRLAHFTAL